MTAEVVRCSPRDIPRHVGIGSIASSVQTSRCQLRQSLGLYLQMIFGDGQRSGSPTFALRGLAEPRLEDDLVPECPPPDADEAAPSPGYEPSILADEEAPPIEGMIAASQSHEVWGGLSRIRRLSTVPPWGWGVVRICLQCGLIDWGNNTTIRYQSCSVEQGCHRP